MKLLGNCPSRPESFLPLGGGNLGNLNLGQLKQFLPNVNFPASREEVASTAQSNDAPQEVVNRIRSAGTDTFNSADEVLQVVQGRL